MNVVSIILFLIIYCDSIFYEIFGASTENSITAKCSNENNCEKTENIAINNIKTTEITDYGIEYNDNNEWELNTDTIYTNKSINSTTKISSTTLPSTFQTSTTRTSVNNINESIITNLTSKFSSIIKNNAKICTCDLTILQCDINCCCDHDCTEFHLTIFSHCTDHQTKKYDSRYCYKKNFIHHNNTKFILEQLTDNLFCIAYDNLPPKYSKSNAIKIDNRKQFNEIMEKNIIKKFTWTQNKMFVPLNFNHSITYRDGDIIWKIESQSIKPIEFPMSGFTSHCTFRKNLQYLKDFNTNCLQVKLSNENNNLFVKTFSLFTVISSPIFINTTYSLLSLNETCPKNMCVPIETKYCINSSISCNMIKPLEASCVNGTCKNIVKGIRYVITHNGTMGITKVQSYIELANVSKSFYQNFNVHYQWADINEHSIHHRSGNPGYLIGKSIIIGTLKPNTTDDITIGNNNTNNETNYFFTVPLATNNGNCHKDNRYIINLGEDIKLKCHIKLMTNNFSHNSCIELQNEILSIFFQQSLVNITDVEQYKIYVSKLGNITNNNNISNWNQILLNKVPNKILKSERNHDNIQCHDITTSLSIDILYSLLPKPDNIDNYKIVGVGVTLIEEETITWLKCYSANCTDNLDVDLITYVKFHDISTPETYYYAGGPNLDISLPYDFFYPFLSGISAHYQSNLFVLTIAVIIIIICN